MSMRNSGRPFRPAAPGHVRARQHEPGRARRREHDVDLARAHRRVLERRQPARRTARRARRLGRASGWRRTRSRRRARQGCAPRSSPILPAPTSSTRQPARSPKTCSASAAAADGDRGRALADRRLRAHLLARVDRLAEQPVEQRPGLRRPRRRRAPGRGSRPRRGPASRARRRHGRGACAAASSSSR